MSESAHILIVDDNVTGQEILAELLTPEGYRLSFADNGKQALEKIAADPPDLVLLDVMMPVMDGFEACRRLRADEHFAELPVVMVTSLDDRESRIKGIEAGADDFITKPVDTAVIKVRVKTILRLDRFRRLMAERARFEWIVERAKTGFLNLSEDGSIDYANPRARFLLGLEEHEQPTQSFLEIAQRSYRLEPPGAWENWPESNSGATKDSWSDAEEVDGTIVVPELPLKSNRRFLVRPETPSTPACWLEVTELTQASLAEVRRTIRLTDVSEEISSRRAIWSFHSLINHKLRTPLTGIVGGIEFFAASAAEMAPEDTAVLAQGMLDEARRLQEEILGILNYVQAPMLARSGLGFGFSELTFLADCIRHELGLEAVSVELPANLEGWRSALTLPAMEMILLELFNNASHHHPEQTPTITVSLELLETYPAEMGLSESGLVALRVTDNGVHLPPSVLEKAWMPYFQGEREHTGQTHGMGLGLSMIATLVWEAGGDCRLKNRTDGPGVVVELRLPAHPSGERTSYMHTGKDTTERPF